MNHKRADLEWKVESRHYYTTIVGHVEHFAKIMEILQKQQRLLYWLCQQRCDIMNSEPTADLRATNGTLCDVHHHEWNMRSSLFHFHQNLTQFSVSFVSHCIWFSVRCEVWGRFRFVSTKNSLETNKFALRRILQMLPVYDVHSVLIGNDFMNVSFNFSFLL